MKTVELKKNGKTVIAKCGIASDFFSRFMGLMGKSHLADDVALFFPRCNSIHTFFMRIPIDVLFVNKAGVVVEILESLKPWKMLLPRGKAKHVIEMRALLSQKCGIQVGDRLQMRGVFE